MGLFEKLMPRADDFFSDFEAQAACVVEGTKLFRDLLEDFTLNMLGNFLGLLQRIHRSTIPSARVLIVLGQVNHSRLVRATRITAIRSCTPHESLSCELCRQAVRS